MTDDLFAKLTSQIDTGLDTTYNEEDEQTFAVVDDMADLIIDAVADTEGQIKLLLRLHEGCPTYWATTRLREVLKNRESGSPAHERYCEAVVWYLGSGDPVLAEDSSCVFRGCTHRAPLPMR